VPGGDYRGEMGWDAREALKAERRRTLQTLRDLSGDLDAIVSAAAGSNADDEHDPEGPTIAFERSQVGSMIEQARTNLTEIAAAEDRLAAGTYGVCELCGGPIGEGRLEARPVARRCIDCASRSR
jgi:DnaK suppressor protein